MMNCGFSWIFFLLILLLKCLEKYFHIKNTLQKHCKHRKAAGCLTDFKARPVLDQGKFSKGALSTWKPVSCHFSLSVAWMEQGGMASLELLSAALGKGAAALDAGRCAHGLAREDGEKFLPNWSSMTTTLQPPSVEFQTQSSLTHTRNPLGPYKVKQSLTKSPWHV